MCVLAGLLFGTGDFVGTDLQLVQAFRGQLLQTGEQALDQFAAHFLTDLRRFLVGPKDCEITGIAESGDGRALFVNIQHPGEGTAGSAIGTPANFGSHWPDGGTSRPRSATVVITRNDGGLIGL